MTRPGIRLVLAGVLAAVVIGWTVPAFAQNGTISGRVVDADRRMTDRDGKPIGGGKPKDFNDPMLGLSEAYVTLELKGETPKKTQVITDAFGEFYKSGLTPGTYDITVRREWRDPIQGRAPKPLIFIAEAKGVVLAPGAKLRVPDMSAMTEEAFAAGRKAPVASNMTNAEAEAANKRNAELKTIGDNAMAAMEAGKYDEGIAMLTDFANKKAERNEPCAPCYVKIGEAELKLKHDDKAEAAFLKAIQIDPKLPDSYSQLANIYNGQRKFEEAAKMTAKAGELAGGGAAGGGGDAKSNLNAGIINWNAGKYPEARDAFARAVKLDPKMAEAQYYLGMTIFNLASSGKATMADAKAPFQEYLKLAPTGDKVDVVKALLATIK